MVTLLVYTPALKERGGKAQGEGSSMGKSFCFLLRNRFWAFRGMPGQPMGSQESLEGESWGTE